MRRPTQRPSPLEVFLLAIFLTALLSSSLALYRDIQVRNRIYASPPSEDHFSISGTPVQRAMLPVRLVFMTSLLVTFIGVRSRKFGGRLLSTLTLLLLIGIFLYWWRHSFNVMRELEEHTEPINEIQTLYLINGNWLDIGVFIASVWALGWVVVTLITHSKESRAVPS